MSRSPLLILVAIASFTTAACDDDASQLGRNPPPTNSGIYGVANGCYTIEAFDGATTLRFLRRGTNDDVYSFSALNSAGGARFHLRASDLGTYLLYDRDRRYFSATSADDGTITFARPATLVPTRRSQAVRDGRWPT